jgi:hypothetical protein
MIRILILLRDKEAAVNFLLGLHNLLNQLQCRAQRQAHHVVVRAFNAFNQNRTA